MNRLLSIVVGVALLGTSLGCPPAPQTTPDVSAKFPPPSHSTLLRRVSAKGDQIYTVKPAAEAGKFEWSAATPDAKLYDEKGLQVGTHGKGPSWTFADGGTVIARLPPAKKETVDPAAVPWLELGAKDGTASGSLNAVTVIHRINTTGGLPPTTGLDAEHVGKETRVPYTADYLFFKPE